MISENFVSEDVYSKKKIALLGFEPRSADPESTMIGRYTTGLWSTESENKVLINKS